MHWHWPLSWVIGTVLAFLASVWLNNRGVWNTESEGWGGAFIFVGRGLASLIPWVLLGFTIFRGLDLL